MGRRQSANNGNDVFSELHVNLWCPQGSIFAMEDQLAELRIQSAELTAKQAFSDKSADSSVVAPGPGTGMAANLLAANLLAANLLAANLLAANLLAANLLAANLLAAARGSKAGAQASGGQTSRQAVQSSLAANCMQRSKEEKDTLSKLKTLSYLSEPKPAEKFTYREFICAMTKVLKLINDLGTDPQNDIAHICFIATKAAKNVYATNTIIKYD